jgi:hypothetical protein
MPGPQGIPGPQGQQGWAPERTAPREVATWAEQTTAQATPAMESGLAMMFWPTKLFASTFTNTIKAQQQLWATMAGAARGGRSSSQY